jgi:hypothetical protein
MNNQEMGNDGEPVFDIDKAETEHDAYKETHD